MVSGSVFHPWIARLLSRYVNRCFLNNSKNSKMFEARHTVFRQPSLCLHSSCTLTQWNPNNFRLPLCTNTHDFLHFHSSVRLYKTLRGMRSPKVLPVSFAGKHGQQNDSAKESVHVDQLRKAKKRMAEKMEELKENVMTIPNALCVFRILASPFLGYFVLQEFYMLSFGLFIFAGFTDLIDGYIARTFPGQQSMIGSFLDPAADKLLIATLFLTLTANGLIPVPLTSLIICRDVCLLTAGFYIRYVSLPPPKTLSRYFDVSFVTARLSPTVISKVNTVFQLSLVGFSLAAPIFGYVDHLGLQVFWFITGFTTVLSAGSYLYCKNTYKLLSLKSRATKHFIQKNHK